MNLTSCGKCIFWRYYTQTGGIDVGHCHRFPPNAISGFPETENIDFCGEGISLDQLEAAENPMKGLEVFETAFLKADEDEVSSENS